MRILFDTNVVLDVLLARAPHAAAAAALFTRVERGELQGVLCATTVTTIHYLAAKAVGRDLAARHVVTLLDLFDVASVTRAVLTTALDAGFADYEDAVLHEAAVHAGATGIVTRNLRDFERATLPIYGPSELLQVLNA